MNCEQANELIISVFLECRGFKPTIKGNSYWYAIREEKTASTKVDVSLNRWFDYGINKGGKLVDLVSCYFTGGNVKQALEIIEGNSIQNDCKKHEQSPIIATETKVLSFTNIQHQALKDYLDARRICGNYENILKEVHYSTGDKNYFALGWKNNAGGWELRNKLFKGCILAKDITTIIPVAEELNNVVDVWEGMFSFLSYLQMWYSKCPYAIPHDIIVLNSVAIVNKAILSLSNYKYVNLYLDNDQAGKNATERFKTVRNDAKDCSSLYAGFKDYNDCLLHNDTTK